MNNDKVSEVYKGELKWGAAADVLRERVHWICRQAEGPSVLDIGCSQGITSILLAREGFHVTGLDIEEPAIEYARADLLKEHPQVQQRLRFLNGDVFDAATDLGGFNTVILGEIIEHVTHPELLLKRALDFLLPEGRLVVTTPFGLLPFHDHRTTFDLSLLLKVLPVGLKCEHLDVWQRYIRLACRKSAGAKVRIAAEDLLAMTEKGLHESEERYQKQADQLNERIKQLQTNADNHRAKEREAVQALAKADLARKQAEEELDKKFKNWREQLALQSKAAAEHEAALKGELAKLQEAGAAAAKAASEREAALKGELAKLQEAGAAAAKVSAERETALASKLAQTQKNLLAATTRQGQLRESLERMEQFRHLEILKKLRYKAYTGQASNICLADFLLKVSSSDWRRIKWRSKDQESFRYESDLIVRPPGKDSKLVLSSCSPVSLNKTGETAPIEPGHTYRVTVRSMVESGSVSLRWMGYNATDRIQQVHHKVADGITSFVVTADPQVTGFAWALDLRGECRFRVISIRLEPESALQLASPTPASSDTSLTKMAVVAVMDEFTAACFAPECRLIQPRPDNWRQVCEETVPSAIFVESAWSGNRGSWLYRVASYQKNMGNELAEMLGWAREKGLPTIFWNKEDPSHFDRFIEKAKLFSHVFTSDSDCVERYLQQMPHGNVFALPFAAQPAVHHPVLEEPRLGQVCFAGTYYGNRHQERKEDMEFLLKPALDFGLDIYDRQHGMAGKEAASYRFPDIYQKSIKGRLDYSEMTKAYKRYRVFLNVNSVKQSPTMFSRRVFELLACGTPVISTYSKGIVELLGDGVVFITESEADTRRHLEKLLGSDEAWAIASARGIRKVLSHHTYEDRLIQIAEHSGLVLSKRKQPRFLLLAKAHSAPELDQLQRMLLAQTYGLFDLMICSPMPLPARALEPLRNGLVSSKVHNLHGPTEAVYEKLKALCSAELMAFWDLRDFYGPNYLADFALAQRYSNAPLMGKATFHKVGAGLQSLGKDFCHVPSVASATLVARTEFLSRELLFEALEKPQFHTRGLSLLSIDRFNYLRGGATASESDRMAVSI